jgi:hypothetical protein
LAPGTCGHVATQSNSDIVLLGVEYRHQVDEKFDRMHHLTAPIVDLPLTLDPPCEHTDTESPMLPPFPCADLCVGFMRMHC